MPYFLKTYNKTFAYHLCPKNGCTSIANMIIQADGNIELLKEDHKDFYRTHALAKPSNDNEQFAWPRVPDVVGWTYHNAEIKLAIKRDPVDRFISGYKNRVLYHKDISKTYHWLLKQFKNKTKHLPEVPSLDTFIKNFDTYWTNPWIASHFKSQTTFLGNKDYYTHVFDITELNKVKELLEEITNIKITVPHLQAGGNDIEVPITDENIKWIKKKYAIDYENGWC